MQGTLIFPPPHVTSPALITLPRLRWKLQTESQKIDECSLLLMADRMASSFQCSLRRVHHKEILIICGEKQQRFWKKEKRKKKHTGGNGEASETAMLSPQFDHHPSPTMSPSSSTNGVAIHRTAASMKSRTTNRRRVPPSIPYQIDLSTSKTGR